MNNLTVIKQDGQLFVDSREVAVMTDKEHGKLLRDIRNYNVHLAEANFGLGDFFIENSYLDDNTQIRPSFLLTKKGCDMVANKMTGSKGIVFTANYIDKFYDMEQQLLKPVFQIPQTYAEALRQLADSTEKNEMLVAVVEEQKPKVEKWDRFLNSDGYTDMSSLAKLLGEEFKGKKIGRNKMMDMLKVMKILTQGNAPSQYCIAQGYFIVIKKVARYGNVNVSLITPKGIDWLVNRLKKEEIKMREKDSFYR